MYTHVCHVMLKVPWYNYAHTYICSTCMCACVYTVVSRIVRNICTETIHPVFCAKILMIRVLLGTGIPGTCTKGSGPG